MAGHVSITWHAVRPWQKAERCSQVCLLPNVGSEPHTLTQLPWHLTASWMQICVLPGPMLEASVPSCLLLYGSCLCFAWPGRRLCWAFPRMIWTWCNLPTCSRPLHTCCFPSASVLLPPRCPLMQGTFQLLGWWPCGTLLLETGNAHLCLIDQGLENELIFVTSP